MAESSAPDVTAIVPALNEEDTLGEVIDQLLALPLSIEVVVVDDGSSDGTPAVISSYGDRIKSIRNPKPGGKGNAIRQALAIATGRTVIIQDADLEYFPAEIPKLVEPILKGEAAVVYGTRFKNGMPAGMALPNKLVDFCSFRR
jgi:dolichol-phosphate mannosyltransferase